METADPDKVVVDRIEFVRAKVVDLPEDMQKFDFDQMMVITTEQWLTDSDATDRIPGIESPTTFVVNSSNDDVAPIDKRAAESFSLSNPVQKDPEWDDWVESITYTDPFSAVRDCADSH
ncbi:MAG: hypothetical protein ACRDTJ_25735 [Pseudonocardiaceae bacterium]